MNRRTITIVAGAIVLAAAGTGAGAAALAGSSAPAATATAAPGNPGYGPMMGGATAPGWMMGGSLPGSMMGGGAGRDPGRVMGSWLANAPGPRVSPADAARLGSQVPAGATVDRAQRRITFTAASVRLAALGSPAGGPDETFRIAGVVNPTIVVPAGAHVSIQIVNTDPDTAHGLVITGQGAASSWMPMMTSAPAFTGAALWVLGNPTTAGMHTASISFTASTPGTYQYLCPIPGHAARGMAGTFIVSGRA